MYLRKLITISTIIFGLLFSLHTFGEDSINYNALFNNDGRLSSRILIDKAWSAIKNERYDSAAAYYTIVASRYSDESTRDEAVKAATASVNVGYIWLSWKMNGQEAYPWLQRAHEIAMKHNIPDVEIGVDSNLGQLYFNYGNYPKAIEYSWNAVKRIMDNKSNLYLTKGLMEFATAAVIYNNDSVLASSVEQLKRYEIADTVPIGRYASQLILALDKFTQRHYKEGAVLLENAVQFLETDTDFKRYITMHLFILGKMLSSSGDVNSAISRLRGGTTISISEKYHNLTEKGYGLLSDCYSIIGNNDSAAYFQNKMLGIRDSLFNVRSFEAIKDMSMATQLSGLTENAKEAQRKASELKKFMLWICVFALVALGLSMGLYISHKKIKAAYRDLYRKNMELIKDSAKAASVTQEAVNLAESLEKSGLQEMDLNEANRLYRKVSEFIAESEDVYDIDFSLERLAEMIGEKARSVSKGINIVTGKNFSTFLSEIRIKEACRCLADLDNMKTMKIESVAEGVGYRSRTHFSKVFKDVTGLTPSQFVNQMKEEAKIKQYAVK